MIAGVEWMKLSTVTFWAEISYKQLEKGFIFDFGNNLR